MSELIRMLAVCHCCFVIEAAPVRALRQMHYQAMQVAKGNPVAMEPDLAARKAVPSIVRGHDGISLNIPGDQNLHIHAATRSLAMRHNLNVAKSIFLFDVLEERQTVPWIIDIDLTMPCKIPVNLAFWKDVVTNGADLDVLERPVPYMVQAVNSPTLPQGMQDNAILHPIRFHHRGLPMRVPGTVGSWADSAQQACENILPFGNLILLFGNLILLFGNLILLFGHFLGGAGDLGNLLTHNTDTHHATKQEMQTTCNTKTIKTIPLSFMFGLYENQLVCT